MPPCFLTKTYNMLTNLSLSNDTFSNSTSFVFITYCFFYLCVVFLVSFSHSSHLWLSNWYLLHDFKPFYHKIYCTNDSFNLRLLCISTSFQVLAAPESWPNYFFQPFLTFFEHFKPFSVILRLKSTNNV